MKTNTAYLITGGNMGDRAAFLAAAGKQIDEHCGHVVKSSSVYETSAWGLENQAAFLNQVLQIETRFTADMLLQQVLAMEERLGRKRLLKYGPRPIDIDILFFNDAVIQTETLTIPHPQMQHRRFVLAPLAELAPDFVHPLLHKTVAQLLDECADPLPVNKWKEL